MPYCIVLCHIVFMLSCTMFVWLFFSFSFSFFFLFGLKIDHSFSQEKSQSSKVSGN